MILSPMTNYVSLKELSEDDQPREKLLKNGSFSLSSAEILGILIGTGTTEKSAIQLCREILASVSNDLDKLALLSIQDLTKFKGIGPAKAVTLAAAFELGRRRKYAKKIKHPIIKVSKDIFELMKPRFEDVSLEEFYVILLNRAHKVLSVELVSKGGFNSTSVDGKVIFKKAFQHNASALILCHNHPSGNPLPSRADIEITRKLKSFGLFIDLPIVDHVIIAEDSFFSFSDQNLF